MRGEISEYKYLITLEMRDLQKVQEASPERGIG